MEEMGCNVAETAARLGCCVHVTLSRLPNDKAEATHVPMSLNDTTSVGFPPVRLAG